MSNSLERLKLELGKVEQSGDMMTTDKVAFLLTEFHAAKLVDVRKDLIANHPKLLLQFDDCMSDVSVSSKTVALMKALDWQSSPGLLGEVAGLLAQVYR